MLLTQLSYTFFALAGFYFFLLLFPLVQIYRITALGYPITKSTTQKTFLTLFSVTSLLRCSFFVVVPIFSNGNFNIARFENPIDLILDDAGCIVFFTTFTLLIIFWAEIIYQAGNNRDFFIRRVRPVYYVTITLIYLAQVSLWVFLIMWRKDAIYSTLVVVDNVLYAGLAVISALGFLYFGGRLYLMLRHSIESEGRKNKLVEVLYVAIMCIVCFITRSVIFSLLTFSNVINASYIVIGIYYFLSEIAPILVVYLVLRKLPPPFEKEEYQPRFYNSNNYSEDPYYHERIGGYGATGYTPILNGNQYSNSIQG
eukprot:TRINITY_DN485_c0_g1_i2.p1 TRINITY_DN485_c0_g1~~TRINITY_DN485_c0_g1_i2.p1  ORF type:complete len:312 (-),score=38.07 TRINITY_DN485_c0_g1_i2:89-1024(-)